VINIFKRNIIEFYADEGLIDWIPKPLPAKKFIPDWYKGLKPYTKKYTNRQPEMTAKKCMPLLDAMTTGYVMPLTTDIYVTTNHDLSVINVSVTHGPEDSPKNYVDNHPWTQIESDEWTGHKQDPLKFINPWIIKTKPGYSCLITAPMNNFDLPFTCMSAIVDTDKYHAPINFPAIWNVPNFEGQIPAGTPLVQVIPFKREKYPAPIYKKTKEKEWKFKFNAISKMATRESVYKNEYRESR
jgi:hypothetical protein